MEYISFAPLVGWPVIATMALISLALVLFALWRGLSGWWLRGLAALVLLTALADPSWKQEDRDYLSDIAFVVIDETASQGIDERSAEARQTEAELETALAALSDATSPLDVRTLRVSDATGADRDRGTLLMTALSQAAAEVSPDRIAGAILVTDGRVHDPEVLRQFPAPVHTILTGSADDWDRRLKVETAPAFAIVGEPVDLTVRVEALGRPPSGLPTNVPLFVSVDGGDALVFDIPTDETVTIPIELSRAGLNVLQLTVPSADGELTERNNAAVLSINGIRDRLRVLLVSGEPYAGERTWRNLLKADSAVDLVHFTILRPPEKQDGVPVFELSLIAFPTRELFMDKIDEFDLIIFDRYRRRGVLLPPYLQNVGRYVRDGGAVLIASGPAFAGAESLSRTVLADVLPARPTARVIEEGFRPRISELGSRHPVTSTLEDFAPLPADEDGPGWGRWFRLIEMEPISGSTIMEGPEGRPLLVLDRPGEGRIAMLASDHAWLWSRGYEGGGPQRELLRRLAHWLMKEPELEEEVLVAEPDGQDVTVTRRSLQDSIGMLTVRTPSGETREIEMTEVGPGSWQARFEGEENGIYRLSEGDLNAVTAVGPASPKEFENPVSTGAITGAIAEATRGGVLRIEDVGTPNLRRVREDRVAAGRNWLGLARREAYAVRDIRLTPLAPGWLMLLLAGSLAFIAWRIEGK